VEKTLGEIRTQPVTAGRQAKGSFVEPNVLYAGLNLIIKLEHEDRIKVLHM